MDGQREAWEQLPEEGAKAFAAFQLYADMPPDKRSLLAISRQFYKKPEASRPAGRISLWSREYKWLERATLKDAWREDLRARAELEEEEKRAAEWARRRIEAREEGWALGSALVERALEILSMPITQRKETKEVVTGDPDENGEGGGQFINQTIIIEPLGVRARDAALIGKIAVELLRVSSGLDATKGLFDLDLTSLSDEQIKQLASGRSINSIKG